MQDESSMSILIAAASRAAQRRRIHAMRRADANAAQALDKVEFGELQDVTGKSDAHILERARRAGEGFIATNLVHEQSIHAAILSPTAQMLMDAAQAKRARKAGRR